MTPSCHTQLMPTPKENKSAKTDALDKGSLGTTAISTERANQSLKAWEKEIGGRSHLADVLILANLDPRLSHLVRLLTGDRYQEFTLLRLCQDANVTPYEVMELYRKTAFLKGQTVAITRTAEAMPKLVEHLVEKATDHEVICFRCKGTGMVNKTQDDKVTPVQCKVCDGMGTIYVEADEKAQTKLLNILQLGPKQTSITAIRVDTGHNSGTGSFSDLIRGSDTAARAIDGDFTEAETADVSPDRGGQAADQAGDPAPSE
jgi:hypothetical protein